MTRSLRFRSFPRQDNGAAVSVSGNQLLSALGSGILPSAISRPENDPLQGQSFEDILAKVQRGQPSEIGIEIGKELNPVSVSLETRKLVGLAADSAAIKGIQRAVVDLGDSIVRLDVSNRVMEAQIDPSEAGVIDRIDGFVSLRAPKQDPVEESAPSVQPALIPARVVRNLSLADLLSSNDPRSV